MAAVLALGLGSLPARAQDAGSAGSFTRFGVGARAIGMSGAYAGIADDATAVYWNSAGLTRLVKPELDASYIPLFADTNIEFVGYGMPTKSYGALGAGYLVEQSGGYQSASAPFGGGGTFSITNSLFELGWAYKVPATRYFPASWGALSAGANLRDLSESIGGSHASGLGGDLGLLYDAPRFSREGSLSAGLEIQNLFAPSLDFGSGPQALPEILDLSPAWSFRFDKEFTGTLAARTNYYNNALHPAVGGECWWKKMFSVRAGWGNRGASMGVGVRYQNYSADYAVVLNDISPISAVSFSMKFGKTQAEMEAEIKKGLQHLTAEDATRVGDDYFNEAERFKNAGNIAMAVNYLEKAVLLSPDNKKFSSELAALKARLDASVKKQVAESSAVLAREKYAQGDLLTSLEYWKSVLEIDPGNAEAKDSITRINARLGSSQKARLQKIQRDMAQAQDAKMLARAQSYLYQGLWLKAIAQSRQILESSPRNAEAGVILERAEARRKEKARSLLRAALDEEGRRNYKSAVGDYRAVLVLYPDARKVKALLAKDEELLSQGISPQARAEAERLYYSAVDQYLKGNYQQASQTLKRILDLDPSSDGALKLKAKLEAAMQ